MKKIELCNGELKKRNHKKSKNQKKRKELKKYLTRYHL